MSSMEDRPIDPRNPGTWPTQSGQQISRVHRHPAKIVIVDLTPEAVDVRIQKILLIKNSPANSVSRCDP